jgi:hypothetical protein
MLKKFIVYQYISFYNNTIKINIFKKIYDYTIHITYIFIFLLLCNLFSFLFSFFKKCQKSSHYMNIILDYFLIIIFIHWCLLYKYNIYIFFHYLLVLILFYKQMPDLPLAYYAFYFFIK